MGQKRTVTEKIQTPIEVGREPMPVSDVLGTDSTEPAVRISYTASEFERAQEIRLFTDYNNRPGNSFNLTLIVPESLAKQFSELLQQDPTLMRKLAEELVNKKYQGGKYNYADGPWKSYSHPPYKEWEQQLGDNGLYFIEKAADPSEGIAAEKLFKFTTQPVDSEPYGIGVIHQ